MSCLAAMSDDCNLLCANIYARCLLGNYRISSLHFPCAGPFPVITSRQTMAPIHL
ncbi:hypothetical protein PILCRDRAFT_817627 [Piloderma croceum F 1598]|uniref:Uncharacterized protein n=1 Tax=Piloderma croceum (strain F 1598) TaxID=765440 RepID=A0A0C3C5A5_PILCF|nr:hypothetical protein PILCRDRAFT_817627 [Piloderma croceum F 1598]